MTIRVLVADDSRTIRAMLKDALAGAGFDVVGEAENGRQAVERAKALAPDVITMDVAMPELDGLEATAAIMAESPSRIVVVCAVDDADSVALSLRAMAAGALEVIAKGGAPDRFCEKVVEAARLMAEVPVVRRRASMVSSWPAPPMTPAPIPMSPYSRFPPVCRGDAPIDVVGLVASTGGPPALAQILAGLPKHFAAAVVVAQHMAPGFVPGLVRWFDEATRMRVTIARDGERAEPGVVYLPPDACDLVVRTSRTGRTDRTDGNDGTGTDGTDRDAATLALVANRSALAPSGDALLSSLAHHLGARAAGVVLTGMGDDGAMGLFDLRRAGGLTLAQDRATSVVHGMPRAAVEAGGAAHVLALDDIAPFLLKRIARRRSE